jgi:hypothetical protein
LHRLYGSIMFVISRLEETRHCILGIVFRRMSKDQRDVLCTSRVLPHVTVCDNVRRADSRICVVIEMAVNVTPFSYSTRCDAQTKGLTRDDTITDEAVTCLECLSI